MECAKRIIIKQIKKSLVENQQALKGVKSNFLLVIIYVSAIMLRTCHKR